MTSRLQRNAGENRLRQGPIPPVEVHLKGPVIEKELLDYLDQMFPSTLPPAGTDPRLIDNMIGARGPIDHLHELFARQQETIL